MLPTAAETLLTRYLALNEDLIALAAETGQSIPALLDWLHTPEIARIVARFRSHQAHQLTTFALNALAAIIASTLDQVEQRRAATTILRTLNAPPTPRSHSRRDDPGSSGDDVDLLDETDDLNQDDPDDSAEADDLEDTEDSVGAETREAAAAEVNFRLEPESAAANPPRATPPVGSPALPSALSTRHPALATPAIASKTAEASPLRISANRDAQDSLPRIPPCPPCTGPPR